MTRNDKDDRPASDPLSEIGRGFSGLMNALGEAIAEVSERLDVGESGEVRRSFEMDTGKGPLRAEAGVRVRFADNGAGAPGAGASKMARPVNPARGGRADPRPEATLAAAVQPIDFEIIDDAETWRLTADIPGVEENELSLGAVDGQLQIETTGHRRYRGVAAMPEGIAPEDIEISLRNGIVELTCSLRKA